MKAPGRDTTEKVLRNLEEMHQKYKLIENSLMQRRTRLRTKMDDLKQSLRLIAALKSRQVRSNLLLVNVGDRTRSSHFNGTCLWDFGG